MLTVLGLTPMAEQSGVLPLHAHYVLGLTPMAEQSGVLPLHAHYVLGLTPMAEQSSVLLFQSILNLFWVYPHC